MIKVGFLKGGVIRQVITEGRKVTIISPELNFEPVVFDLDKMDLNDPKFAKFKDLVRSLHNLKTEEEIVEDFKKDWEPQGWELMKNVSNN